VPDNINATPVVSFAYTAVDGTFTLGNVPENATYTLVIQSGKWRRQFSETVDAGPLTGLSLNMPSTHAQGDDIPLIAIATGSDDAMECVLRKMGIADSEFTDDNGTTGGESICIWATICLERRSMPPLPQNPYSWALPRIPRSSTATTW
jgi:hypothetical protein